MKAGIAHIDITPPLGTPLAGSCTLRAASKVLDRLVAQALVLEQDGRRYAIVAADLLGYDERMVARLRSFCKARIGIGFLLCNASHAHSCPDAYNGFQIYTDRRYLAARKRYQCALEFKLRRVLAAAARQLQPVTLRYGTGRACFGINRRRPWNGEWAMMPNPKGFHDKTVTVFEFAAAASGEPLAVLISYACHPTTRYATEVSADYPGVARRIIEKRTGAMAMFLQGACGDIRPNVVQPGSRPARFRSGTQKDVDRCGRELGAEVLQVLRRPMKSLDPLLAARETSVALPFDRLPTADGLRVFRDTHHEHELRVVWANRMLRRLQQGGLAKGLPTEVQLLRFSRGHALLATGHELCNGYVPLFQRQAKGTKLTVLGYTNACRGYIPTRQGRLEGGYEGQRSIYNFGLPAPFRPSVESVLVGAARRVLR
ncbi:MAG: neutral/alkaline non-lysosomal ceramidase N-terminal domain-containing protein [Verrucomicrobiae bacterium]|nr:neutral/alkaline non-lysosomal ceramidase N-terminal domain-containing protein [Verrucomicrobiae bacterium]